MSPATVIEITGSWHFRSVFLYFFPPRWRLSDRLAYSFAGYPYARRGVLVFGRDEPAFCYVFFVFFFSVLFLSVLACSRSLRYAVDGAFEVGQRPLARSDARRRWTVLRGRDLRKIARRNDSERDTPRNHRDR